LEFAQAAVSVTVSSLSVEDVVFYSNAEAGIAAEAATFTVRRALFHGNAFGISLSAANALVENSTFLGPTLGDVSLDLGSRARLRACVRESALKLADDASRVDLEGIVTVRVTDRFGVPQAGASVLIEDNPTNRSQVLRSDTNPEGRVSGIVVTQRIVTKLGGPKDFNPFRVTAGEAPAQAFADIVVDGVREVELAIPADLTPPTALASTLLAVDEDVALTLDASASWDNDPSFAATGTFLWTFPDLAVQLVGRTASITFATPGSADGVLTAIDAVGNEAFLSFSVLVCDVTPPTIVSISVPARGGTGETLVFDSSASDNDPRFAQGSSYLWRFTRGATVVEIGGPRVALSFGVAGTWTVELSVRDPTGNEVVEREGVLIVAPPIPNPWPAVIALAAFVSAASTMATERGKAGLFALFLPLYTRLKDDEVLDQFTRGQIFGYIRVHPGDTYTDIKRNLGLNNGTLTYHLDVLGKQGYVRAVVRGARKMFFPVDVQPPEDGAASRRSSDGSWGRWARHPESRSPIWRRASGSAASSRCTTRASSRDKGSCAWSAAACGSLAIRCAHARRRGPRRHQGSDRGPRPPRRFPLESTSRASGTVPRRRATCVLGGGVPIRPQDAVHQDDGSEPSRFPEDTRVAARVHEVILLAVAQQISVEAGEEAHGLRPPTCVELGEVFTEHEGAVPIDCHRRHVGDAVPCGSRVLRRHARPREEVLRGSGTVRTEVGPEARDPRRVRRRHPSLAQPRVRPHERHFPSPRRAETDESLEARVADDAAPRVLDPLPRLGADEADDAVRELPTCEGPRGQGFHHSVRHRVDLRGGNAASPDPVAVPRDRALA